MGTEKIPIACDMNAFSVTQRARYQDLRRKILTSVNEIREEPAGYSFRFHNDASTLVDIAEWISLERMCCPFLHFTIQVLPAGGSIWLKLGEGSEIKEFLRHEFSRTSSPEIVPISPPSTH